jgi:poly(3-hydroxybutyrate) depolymerase
MSRKKGNTHYWCGFPAIAVLCAWVFSASLSAAPALEEVAAGVKLDPTQISVSGISSGGFMAHQFHLAHSQHIMGAGIVAGGPYYCARGNIVDALTRCSRFATLECLAAKLDPKLCGQTKLAPKSRSEIERAAAASFAEARKQESAGKISSLANLRDDKIYLFSGSYDEIVPNEVMATVFRFYADPDKGAVRQGNIHFSSTFPARHTMVRDSFGKPAGSVVGDCALPPAPPPPTESNAYIDDCQAVAEQHQEKNHCTCPAALAVGEEATAACPPPDKLAACKDLQDVDLAGAILRRIYGAQALSKGRMPVQENELQAFDQRKVFGKFSNIPHTALQNASMAREGYVFIPAACKDGRQCKLHIAFHGCKQGGTSDYRPGHTGNLFAKYAGYNEWAKANDVLVLYPQIQARSLGPVNPRGCWDWWGQNYTHAGYHTRDGKQIKAVAQMINSLVGGQPLLEVPPE